MKKSLPGSDASILADLAQSVNLLPEKELEEMMLALSCEETRKIARNILIKNKDNSEAKAFLEWAESLRSRP
jgi:hypothetical protein